jgi:phage gp45-like
MALTEIVKVVRSYLANRNGGPAITYVAEAKGLGGLGLNAEIYQAPGLVSRPCKGAEGIFLPVGKGRSYGIVIAMKNYDVNVSINDGETSIFSTTSDGKTVQARVDLDANGLVKIANRTKSLKTIMDSILEHVAGAVTVGTATTQTLNPATIAALQADKANLALLLKD